MPKQRFSKLSDAKQRHILSVATEAFAKHGYAGASYNQIIAAAGVSKGAMYYYFEDKLDLYTTVIQRVIGGLLQDIGPMPHSESAEHFWRALQAQLAPWLSRYLNNTTLLGLVRSLSGVRATGPGAHVLNALNGELNQWLEQMITEGQRVGAIRTDLPRTLLIALFASVGETMDFWIADNVDEVGEEAILTLGPQLIAFYKRLAAPE